MFPTILFLIVGFSVVPFEVVGGEVVIGVKLLDLDCPLFLMSSIFEGVLTESDWSVWDSAPVWSSSEVLPPSVASLSASDSALAIFSSGPRNLVLKTAQEPSPTNAAMTTRRLINP